MRIPEAKIEEIRSSADIVDVISAFVQLRKRGKNFLGLCPFHNEKTPSFTVSADKQIFHCFGCHSGGNVFKFLMEYKKISYVEAIQELANQIGISIIYDTYLSEGEVSETELLYDLNTETAKYFSDNLLNRQEGEVARKYFEKRKIKIATIRAFGLGYSLPQWDSFINHANNKKLDLSKVLYLGLIGKRTDGSHYDKFAGRIIFPIFSPNGRVVAFAGRILDNKEGSAKYLNSPESKIYYKGKLLYGLSFSKEEIRRQDFAIIVEGYMDLISLYQSGIKNVIAVSGTALTDDQAQLLGRYTKNVILIFDSDTAGINASVRSIEILLRQDFNIKIASLPASEDPDSFVQKNGKIGFEEIIQRAQNFLEYQTEFYFKQGMFNDPVNTTKAIRELVKPISLINDNLKRTLLIKSLSDKFNLREKLLEAELDNILEKSDKESASFNKTNINTRNENIFSTKEVKYSSREMPVIIAEKELLKLLCEGNDELIGFIFNYINPEDFLKIENQKISAVIIDAFRKNENLQLSSLIDKFSENEKTYLLELTFEKYKISEKWDIMNPVNSDKILFKMAADNLKTVKTYNIDNQLQELVQLMQKTKNEAEQLQFLHKQNELHKQKKLIEKEFL
jgi:DNA primase